ncbi:unnamed protein product, partial [Adineta ricciae]
RWLLMTMVCPGYYDTVGSGRNPAARNLPELAGIGENCAGIEKSYTGTDSDFNGSSRRNDRPGIAVSFSPKFHCELNPIEGSWADQNNSFDVEQTKHSPPCSN